MLISNKSAANIIKSNPRNNDIMTTEDFNIFVTAVSKEIDEGKKANEEDVFLKRAQENAIPLDDSEIQLLKMMKYTNK